MAWYIMYDEDLVRSQGVWANHGYIDKIFMNGRWKYIYDKAQAAGARLRQGAQNMVNNARNMLTANSRRQNAMQQSYNVNTQQLRKGQHIDNISSNRDRIRAKAISKRRQNAIKSHDNMYYKTIGGQFQKIRDRINDIRNNSQRRQKASNIAWRNANKAATEHNIGTEEFVNKYPSNRKLSNREQMTYNREHARQRSRLAKRNRYEAEAERARKRSKRII